MPRSSMPSALKAQLKDMLLTPTFMMCRPDFYDPSLEAHGASVENEFMGQGIDREKTLEQWHSFKDKLEELGAMILLVEPQEGLLDQVYTADPAAFHTGIKLNERGLIEQINFQSLRSKFTNTERQKEANAHNKIVSGYINVLKSTAYGIIPTTSSSIANAQFNTEGSGDNVYDTYRGLWWSGFVQNPKDPNGGRSDIKAHDELEALTDRTVLSLEVMRPYFHIDTSTTPLPGGHVLSYAPGITKEAMEIMKKVALVDFGLPEDEYLIKVSKEDAEAFLCNLTAVNDKDLIVPHDTSEKALSQLANAGYRPHPIDYSEIRKGGGLFHCTANRINMIGPKGGIANDPDFYERIEMALS